jgi:hypothetical protein
MGRLSFSVDPIPPFAAGPGNGGSASSNALASHAAKKQVSLGFGCVRRGRRQQGFQFRLFQGFLPD